MNYVSDIVGYYDQAINFNTRLFMVPVRSNDSQMIGSVQFKESTSTSEGMLKMQNVREKVKQQTRSNCSLANPQIQSQALPGQLPSNNVGRCQPGGKRRLTAILAGEQRHPHVQRDHTAAKFKFIFYMKLSLIKYSYCGNFCNRN